MSAVGRTTARAWWTWLAGRWPLLTPTASSSPLGSTRSTLNYMISGTYSIKLHSGVYIFRFDPHTRKKNYGQTKTLEKYVQQVKLVKNMHIFFLELTYNSTFSKKRGWMWQRDWKYFACGAHPLLQFFFDNVVYLFCLGPLTKVRLPRLSRRVSRRITSGPGSSSGKTNESSSYLGWKL